MSISFFTVAVLSFYSACFGITMKLADLLDEHGLKWFTGSDLLFGFLWGIFGALLMTQSVQLSVFLCALVIHWVLRYRIDYPNHGVAATIMLVTFLYIFPHISFSWTLFGLTLGGFGAHGLLNDAADKGWIKGAFAKYFQSNVHWVWIPLFFALTKIEYWDVLLVSTVFIISYELTKHFGMKIVRTQQVG